MLIRYEGKVIGKLENKDGDCVFTKNVDPAIHRLRIFNAYGIQKVFFDDKLKGQKGQIVIKEKEGQRLESSIKRWEEKGIVRDFGDGQQIFLQVRYMQGNKPEQQKLL